MIEKPVPPWRKPYEPTGPVSLEVPMYGESYVQHLRDRLDAALRLVDEWDSGRDAPFGFVDVRQRQACAGALREALTSGKPRQPPITQSDETTACTDKQVSGKRGYEARHDG